MSGWFGGQKRRREQKQAAINEKDFDRILQWLEKADPSARLAVAFGVNLSLQHSNIQLGSPERFLQQPPSDQVQRIAELSVLEKQLHSQGDEAPALGVALVKLYLAPLIDRNWPMVSRMAAKLEFLDQQASLLATLMPERGAAVE